MPERLSIAVPGGATRGSALWLGQMVSEEFLHQAVAASPAGNRWQTGLLTALQASGVVVDVAGCTPQPAWPSGPLFASRHEAASIDGQLTWSMQGFLNVPGLKLLGQYDSLLRHTRGLVDLDAPPSVVISYNVGMPEALTARWLQTKCSIPWVCIVADFPGTSDAVEGRLRRHLNGGYASRQRKWLMQAQARVFLSWDLYQRDPGPRKFYLEGGIRQVHARTEWVRQETPVVMFSGSLSGWTGVEALLDAMPHVRSRCELWISGRGALADRVREAAARDPRIRYFGLVSEAELEHLMARATVFVNPRPSTVPENGYNFPSKLLDYFSWGRPVVSTLTPGIPPVYRSLVFPLFEEAPRDIAATLDRVLSMPSSELEAASERIRRYAADHLLWSAQAQRLWSWIETDVLTVGVGSRT